MRIYDNAHPEGVTISTRRPLSKGESAQERANVQGTCPVCPTCGHRMQLRPSLKETPWRQMKPNGPNWEDETERVLARLAKEVARLKAAGLSKYVCTTCNGLR